MRSSSFLSSLALAIWPNLSSAQDLRSNLPLDMGTPVEEQEVSITTREPIYAFLEAATGEREHRFTACTSDGGTFIFEMTLQAEISSINSQLDKFGEAAYKQRITHVSDSVISSFQMVANQFHGQDLADIATRGHQYPQKVELFKQNLTTVQDHQLRQAVGEEIEQAMVVPNFSLLKAIGPGLKSPCWKPKL